MQDETCVQLWIGQLLIVSWMGGPSRLQCQPYWLSLIPQHSVFVYGASENLTTCGTPGVSTDCHNFISKNTVWGVSLLRLWTDIKCLPGSKHTQTNGVWNRHTRRVGRFLTAVIRTRHQLHRLLFKPASLISLFLIFRVFILGGS